MCERGPFVFICSTLPGSIMAVPAPQSSCRKDDQAPECYSRRRNIVCHKSEKVASRCNLIFYDEMAGNLCFCDVDHEQDTMGFPGEIGLPVSPYLCWNILKYRYESKNRRKALCRVLHGRVSSSGARAWRHLQLTDCQLM